MRYFSLESVVCPKKGTIWVEWQVKLFTRARCRWSWPAELAASGGPASSLPQDTHTADDIDAHADLAHWGAWRLDGALVQHGILTKDVDDAVQVSNHVLQAPLQVLQGFCAGQACYQYASQGLNDEYSSLIRAYIENS